jgi:hypothetical protein
MARATLLAPELEGLEKLNAAELTQRLKKYIDGGGGLVTPSQVEIARECVRRARWAEGASARADRLEGLDALDAARLHERLKAYFEAAGPQATEGEVVLGRELLTRARKAENLERLLGGPGGAAPLSPAAAGSGGPS